MEEISNITNRRFTLAKWRIFWLLLTFVGLLFTGSLYVAKSSSGQPFNILNLLNAQMLRFQIWALFSLVVVWTDHQFRKKTRRWAFLFPLHLLAGIIWSAVITGIFCPAAWFFDGLINSKFDSLPAVFAALGISNFVMGIVGYKIILTTNYAIDYYKKFQDEKHRSALLEAQLAQAQLQALKMQLQPHFLFNTLNSISNLALENPRETVQMIARLGDFLRLTIESNGTQRMSLEKELEFLRHYLAIEQIRFGDRLNVEMDITPDALKAEVPNLLLQPLVENAIKHGLAKSAKAGKIKIGARRVEDRLLLKVENDGALVNGNGTARDGLGITNTRARLRQLFADDFTFELVPLSAGGAVVNLEIPFRLDLGEGEEEKRRRGDKETRRPNPKSKI